MTEDDFRDTVAAYAQAQGWLVSHQRPARTKEGWRTAVMYDGKGFPDLVLVRNRVIIAEVKTERGSLEPDQRKWRAAFEACPDATYFVWRPRDWPTIEQVLRRAPRGS